MGSLTWTPFYSHFCKAASPSNDITMTGWLMQRVIVVNYLKKNGCGTANILRHFSSTQKCHGGDPSDIHPPTLDHGGEKCYYPHRDVTIGNREIVGFGINGKSIYQDDVHVPFPSIRFKERTNVKLLEKEKGDWKKLTIEEKKDLYRQTFGNTFAEINTPIHHQGADLGKGIWLTVGIIYGYIIFYLWLYKPNRGKAPPDSPWNTDEWLAANVQKMLDLENQPITGIASCWDYEKEGWKAGRPQAFRNPMMFQGNELNSYMGWDYNPF